LPSLRGSWLRREQPCCSSQATTAYPLEKAEVVADARRADIARATENGVWVVRSDVAGRADGRVSYGSSEIVDPGGRVVRAARRLEEDLLVAEIGRVAPTPVAPTPFTNPAAGS
jgi:predicted amidohydrolase